MAEKLGGVLGVSATGGSTSTRDAFLPMRTAGAVARDLLLRAAMRKTAIPVGQLTVVDGEVRRRDGTKVATFGELVDFVDGLSAMPPPPLKKPSEFKLIGSSPPRLDIPAKVAGTATFGIDVRLPGLLYAAVRNAPTFGGSASGFTIKNGGLPKGIEKVVIVPGGIAAIGTSWWQADNFLDKGIEINWQAGPEPKLDSAALWKRYAELLESGKVALERKLGTESKPAKSPDRRGDLSRAVSRACADGADELHGALQEAGTGKPGVELWMPNQSPTLMRLIAAKTADIPQADVAVHTTFLGGGFGRRAEVDLVRQAVTCALAMPDRPVQVLWSREEDIRHDYYRPMALARWRAELDVSGGTAKLASVAKRQVGQSPADQFTARLGLPAQGQPEGNAVENPAYGFPFYRLEAIVPDGSVPVGFWRSVGHSHTAFFDESFVDELALALKKDPFEFRRELLADKPRHRQGAGDRGQGSGLGLAAAAGIGARHRHARLLRLDRGAGRRSVGRRRKDLEGQARHLRHRLRAGGQSRHRAHADGERHRLRPVGRAPRRDHAGERCGRAGELHGLPGGAAGRCAGHVRAHRRQRRLDDRRRRRARHAADCARGRQCGVRRHRPAPAQPAAQARLSLP